jgi:putative endonuclease
MKVKDALGRYGELVAAEFLAQAGMRIVARNWRCATGEIDIVAAQGGTLVFCEVKTRSSLAFGSPAEAVTYAKQRRLRALALCYLAERPGSWQSIRFDVVAILRPRDSPISIEHLQDVLS